MLGDLIAHFASKSTEFCIIESLVGGVEADDGKAFLGEMLVYLEESELKEREKSETRVRKWDGIHHADSGPIRI